MKPYTEDPEERPEFSACRERTPEELNAYIDSLTRRIKENAEARRGRSV
jgi:hypothetical protein